MKAIAEFAPVVLVFVVLPAVQMWESRRSIRRGHLAASALVMLLAIGTFFGLLPDVRRCGWGALLPLMGVLAAGAVALGALSCLVFGALFMALAGPAEREPEAPVPPRQPRSAMDKARLAFRSVVLVVLPVASLAGVRDATIRALVWCGVAAVIAYFVWVIFMPRDDDIRTRRRRVPGRGTD